MEVAMFMTNKGFDAIEQFMHEAIFFQKNKVEGDSKELFP